MNFTNKITSRENQKLKHARKVRDGKIAGLVFVEGIRQCEEILRSRIRIFECFYADKLTADRRFKELLDKISGAGIPITLVEPKIFDSIADTKNSQGIVIIAEKPETNQASFEQKLSVAEIDLIVFLSEINNPSNLGAILRTAEAAGANGVIVSTNSTDAFSAKSARSALGANFRLPIWANAETERVIEWAKEKKLVTTAADINGAKEYSEIDWKIPRLLIFGSEAHGLHESHKSRIEEIVHISMENAVESLNLAVSCGIILFEAKRQRKSE